jgi:hypothetical protein
MAADDVREWIKQIDDWQRRLAPRLPDVDPHDLRMILRSILQPASIPRRWLLRRTGDGRYVL